MALLDSVLFQFHTGSIKNEKYGFGAELPENVSIPHWFN